MYVEGTSRTVGTSSSLGVSSTAGPDWGDCAGLAPGAKARESPTRSFGEGWANPGGGGFLDGFGVSGDRGLGREGGRTAFRTTPGSSRIHTEQGWAHAMPELSEDIFQDNFDAADSEEDNEMG
jgi:hypothetical protein